MDKKLLRSFAALLGWFLVAGAGLAQPMSVHWKSTIEIEGGRQPSPGPIQAEMWLKQGRMRTKTAMMGMTMHMVKAGDTVYQWTEGEKTGMKMSAVAAQRHPGGGDAANRIDEYRAKGKKIGAETIDGHPCEIYVLTTAATGAGGPRKETAWLASDLHYFPVKVITESDGGKQTTRNRDIEWNAAIPDAMVTPPKDVEFQDMSEMMKGMRPPGQ
ncbi:MAG TPA: DUF4412 domain-containing protein [Thermoanaerobaculia bacterium]|nr:DUF4412 domain-containing protein [Thermoanaerobaculia bacterium]